MKMKKIAIIAASLLLVATLGSCRGRGRGGSSETSGSGSEQPTTGLTTGTSQGGSSATSSNSSSSGKTSSSKTSSKTSTTSGSQKLYEAEDVIKEICLNLFESAVEGDDYEYYSEYDFYVTGVSFGTEYADEAYLLAAIETIESYLPTYSEVYEEPDVYDDEEGGKYGASIYVTDDFSVAIQIESYVYDTTTYGLCADIMVYNIEE